MAIDTLTPTRMTRPTAMVLVLAAFLCAVYLMLPSAIWAEGIRALGPILAIGVVLMGVAKYQPERSLGWMLMAAGFAFQAAGVLVFANLHFAGNQTFPSMADLLRLLAILLFVGALVVMSQDGATGDAFGPIETAIVAIAVGMGVWLLVIEPYIAERELPFGDKIWATIIPLIGALALAVSFRSATQGKHRVLSPILVAAGLAIGLMAETLRSVSELGGQFGPGGSIAALSLISPLVMAAGALDPTMARRNRPAAVDAAGLGRVVGLSVAALTPLTILFALTVAGLGTRTTRILAVICALIVVVLALTRMWGLVATVRSLTERRGQDRLAAMVEHSSDVVILVDDIGDIRYASPGLSSTLGHRSSDWIARPVIDLVVNDDRKTAEKQLKELIRLGPGGTVKFEASLVRVDGQRRRMEATIANLIGGEAVDGIVATFRDVTEQRDLETQLSHRAFHDELTGLANRALFLERMDLALKLARAETDPVIVLFVDLDDFKAVNDALGHAVGDQLLRHIADRIRNVAGSGDTPARLGGDEFALLLEERGGVDRALDVAERLLDMLREPVSLAGYDLAVLASVGVAVATPGMTTSSLLRDADIAMYEAKRAGKGQIKIFDPAMRLSATKHLQFRSELGNALDHEQLRLVFQPLIDMRTGDVLGAEALVRWRHSERGEISPAEFIPIAERSGLIVPIGAWVLDESVRQAAEWQRGGPRKVSVNVSAVQLRNSDFAGQVSKTLQLHGLPPEHLTLEITETALVGEIEAASSILNDLRAVGVQIAIDDFGTGYCSLSYLQRFPVDIVKIDKQFIDELGGDRKRASLAQMILQLTASLGVVSVAEGIELPEQLADLRAMGCDVGQGFLLSRPLEADVIRQRFGLGLPAPVAPPVLIG